MGRGLLTTVLLLAAISAVASIGADEDTPSRASAQRAAAETSSGAAIASPDGADPAVESDVSQESPEPARRLFSGKVVLLPEALKRRKIEVSDEEIKDQVVLETVDGELIPIVPDWRGRAFFQDERLRDRKVDLVGYRPAGTPYLKVLMVFTFDEDGQRQYMDYWCDICSIPMYEIQRCECCQGPIRLRFQPRDLPEYVDGDSPERAKAGDGSTGAPGEGGTSP